jgi:hypothetical protein
VTLEDVLETALGTEIVDEHDKVDDLQALARTQGSGRVREGIVGVPEPPHRAAPPNRPSPGA